MNLLDRYKVPFYYQQLEETRGCLVSKDSQKRRNTFRVKLKKRRQLTSIDLTSIKVWAYNLFKRTIYWFVACLILQTYVSLFCVCFLDFSTQAPVSTVVSCHTPTSSAAMRSRARPIFATSAEKCLFYMCLYVFISFR